MLTADPTAEHPETHADAGPEQPGRWHWAALTAVFLAGAALRCRVYLHARSLWGDEGFLAYNIVTRGFGELFGELDHFQVAPIGFMLAAKACVAVFGEGDLPLRLWPFLCGLGALPLMYWLGRIAAGRGTALLATTLLALSPSAIYYSNEFKPYGPDATISLLLLCLGLGALRDGLTTRRLIVLAGVGSLVVWFSFPSVFILGALGLGLLVQQVMRRRWAFVGGVTVAGVCWLACIYGSYLQGIRSLGTRREEMSSAWSKQFDRMDEGLLGVLAAIPGRLTEFVYVAFYHPLVTADNGERMVALGFLMIAVAVVVGGVRAAWWTSIAGGVLVLALIAESMGKYPIDGRLLMYAMPLVLLLIAAGTVELIALIGRRRLPAAVLVACLLLFPARRAAFTMLRPPPRYEIRDALVYVAKHAEPGDHVYVEGAASGVFGSYRRWVWPDRWDRLVIDSPPFMTTLRYKDYHGIVVGMRGRTRQWVVTPYSEFSGLALDRNQGDALWFALDQYGQQLDEFRVFGARAYLYDLSERPAPPPPP